MKKVQIYDGGRNSACIYTKQSTVGKGASQRRLLWLAAFTAAGVLSNKGFAASGSWTGTTDPNWADANWSAAPVPGVADTATFNTAGGLYTTIDLGAGVTVNKIVFDSSSAAAYTIGNYSAGTQTLSLNTSGGITMTSTVANNELVNSGIVLGTNANAASYSIINNSVSNSLTIAGNISGGAVGGTAGTETLIVGGAGNTVISGSLLNGGAGQTLALTKISAGTLTFNGATNAATLGSGAGGGAYGAVAVNSGALVLDFSNFGAVGNANLLNSYTPVALGGGTLQIIGNATNASTQSFNNGSGVTVNPGLNVISVGPNAGNLANPLPTLNLGGFTQTLGSQTVFNGPAYYNSASNATAVLVPSTGTITTTTLGNQNKLLWPTSRVGIATVGLYNWASVVTTPAGTNSILSGDQVTGFYAQVAAGGTVAAADTNYDLLGNATASNTATWFADTLRFNVPGAFSFTTPPGGTNHAALIGGILVTPNVGANNTSINNGGAWLAAVNNATANSALDIYQNNTAGELLINVPLYFLSSSARAMSYVQGGPGTVVLTGSGTSSGNIGAPYLNGGYTVINADTQIGAAATAATLYMNGGTLVASGSMNLGNGATANPRPITLLGNGGGLAAVAGTTIIVDGQIGSAANVGTLVIGIPASSANGNVAGLLPGTGTGTANITPVYATGTVALTYANNAAGNFQYSPTLITAGATLQINSQYDLGGANAGSLTFNNGTLQYSTTLATGAAGSALDISAQPMIFAGNATIDTNGHSVTYANSIGNGGSGLLTVVSTATGGSLTLAGANTYTGGTNIASGTLNVTNTTGSATGTGPVTLNAGTLSGSGIISGTVNANGGTIAPGAPGTTLTLGSLNYTSGNLNFSINGSAGTSSQISAGSVTFNAKPTFGTVTLTAAAGLTNNEVFTVLTSASPINGSSYVSGLTSQSAGRFIFTPSESISGNSIILTATGYEANLFWQGGVSGLGTATAPKGDGSTWNDKQTTGASNFYNGNSNVNGYDYFYDLDNVTFNDTVVSPGTGSLGHIVNVASNVSPSSVTVATASNYTFFGTGSVTGLGNVLVSSGTLILENASNSYSGGTNISSGAVLQTSAATVLPVTGNVTVAGTLDLNGYNQSIGGLSDGGVFTGIVQSTGAAATLTTNATGSSTFGGTLQNGTGTLSLTTSGTGTQILTGLNTYTGGTTINAGSTLQIGSNLSLPSAQPVTDNGSLVFNLSSGTYVVTSAISGTGSVTQNGLAGSTLQMSSNTYSGGTIIKSGVIQLTGATGTGTGDVTISAGTNLDLNGFSPTVGALNGAGVIDSSTVATMTLTIGNNNDSGAFSGTIKNTNGTLTLMKAGTGTQALSGVNTYSGTTTVTAGTLNITNGSIGTVSVPAAALYANTGGTLSVSGGSIYAPSISVVTFPSALTMSSGTISLSGNLGISTGNSGGVASLTGGTLTANSVTDGRIAGSYGTNLVQGADTTDGLYVNGATVNIATTMNFASGGAGSSMRIDNGSITVGGTTVVSNNAANRYSIMEVTGGTFTSNDTTGAGVQIGGYVAGATELAGLLVSGGTLITNTLTLGDSMQTGGTDQFLPTGGTTYIGTGGIVAGGASNTTLVIGLGSATSATAPTIAANGDWASSLAMTIANSSAASGSLPVTFQAQSSAGVAHNITLSGVLSGTGGIVKTGGGTLTLSGSNTYTGGTNVPAGTLVLASGAAFPSGNAQAGTSLTVGSGAKVQIANYGSNPTYVPIVSSLTNAGTIDLTNNAMIIRNVNASIGTINSQVAAAYNRGNWNGSSGTGVITSSLAAGDSTHLTAVGVATGLTTTFEGVSVSPSDILLKYTYYGDANLDGHVDGSDYSIIDNGAVMGLTGWYNGDFNYDGVIDGSDYALIDNSFNTQGANLSSEIASATAQIAGGAGVSGAGASAVPEPATLGLLGIGAAGLLGRRRRPLGRVGR